MRLPASLRDAPILRKLVYIAVVATLAGTLFAMLALVVQQWYLMRNELANNIYAQASIVATNSTSALLFGDRDAAEQTLGALAAIDNIEFAQLFDKTGKKLAAYVRPGLMQPSQQHTAAESNLYTTKYIEIVIPVVLKQEEIGFIHVRSDLTPVYKRLAWSMLVTLVAASFALLGAVMMLLRLLPAITDPLSSLVGLMNAISRDKNYSLRSQLQGKDELGTLAQGFNNMLTQIQARDDELARHREHLEQEVAQRTARLTEAQRIAHLGNWEWDIVSNTLDWSDEIYRIFGLTPQQFGATYEAFLQAVHPEDRPLVDAKVREGLEHGSPYSIDHRILLPDGSLRYVHEQAEVQCNEDGQGIKMQGTVQDITERKRAAQALEESERKFRAILEAMVDGILVADGETHRFVLGNRAICDMLGYQQHELGQLGVSEIHPEEALPEVQRQFERQLGGEIKVAANLPVKRRDGSVFFADVSSSPMELAGHPFLVGIFHDVSERMQAEENVRKLNEELEAKVKHRTQQLLDAQDELVRKGKLAVLGQVAGSVGHELRNPLGVMSNAVYFLQTVLVDADDSVKEYLNIIKSEIAGSERIVSDLLDSVRTKPPQPEAVGVAELIAQTLHKCSVPASVSVKLDIPATLPPLRVDPQQIHQVLRNLISNGIEAMPEGGTLQISAVANAAAKNITVSVQDSGTGMTPEQLGHLFQPLFTTKARGIGLGLVVVKNLTQANGGTVKVESEAGKGSVFSVMLPADQ